MAMFEKRAGNDDRENATSAQAPDPRPAGTGVSTARDIARIGASITIQGDVTGDENLIIDDKVDGTAILEKHDLTIGQSGLVTASVRARVVKIEGEVTGDIHGLEKVVLTKTGRVKGNIVAPRVTLEDGAKFKGRIDMDPASTRPPATQKPLESASPADVVRDPPKPGFGHA